MSNNKSVSMLTPGITLSGVAIVAIAAYLQHYSIFEWLLIVLGSIILFWILGAIITAMIRSFINGNQERARIAEEQAAKEQEEEEVAGENEDIPLDMRNQK